MKHVREMTYSGTTTAIAVTQSEQVVTFSLYVRVCFLPKATNWSTGNETLLSMSPGSMCCLGKPSLEIIQ